MAYSIQLNTSVKKDVSKLPFSVQKRLKHKIIELAENPYMPGCKKIRGYKDYFRIQVGDFRIVYCVKDEIKIVKIIRIGNRKDVYKKLA